MLGLLEKQHFGSKTGPGEDRKVIPARWGAYSLDILQCILVRIDSHRAGDSWAVVSGEEMDADNVFLDLGFELTTWN